MEKTYNELPASIRQCKQWTYSKAANSETFVPDDWREFPAKFFEPSINNMGRGETGFANMRKDEQMFSNGLGTGKRFAGEEAWGAKTQDARSNAHFSKTSSNPDSHPWLSFPGDGRTTERQEPRANPQSKATSAGDEESNDRPKSQNSTGTTNPKGEYKRPSAKAKNERYPNSREESYFNYAKQNTNSTGKGSSYSQSTAPPHANNYPNTRSRPGPTPLTGRARRTATDTWWDAIQYAIKPQNKPDLQRVPLPPHVVQSATFCTSREAHDEAACECNIRAAVLLKLQQPRLLKRFSYEIHPDKWGAIRDENVKTDMIEFANKLFQVLGKVQNGEQRHLLAS